MANRSNRDSPDWLKLDSKEWLARSIARRAFIVLDAAVNSTANLETREGKVIVVGNSTEGALLQWLKEDGVPYEKLRLDNPVLYQKHFSSERKRMTTVIRKPERPTAGFPGQGRSRNAAGERPALPHGAR